jgi:two-component system, NtrC family, sensor histidine kinase GlrK
MPILVITVALVLLLVAMVRISMVLTAVNEGTLVVLRGEGALHRSAWVLDVALRHSQEQCAAGAPAAEVAGVIRSKTEQLREQAARSKPGPLKAMAMDYVQVAERALGNADPCRELAGGPAQLQRAKLDEWLTNAWVDRLEELHIEVNEQEGLARALSVWASWLGIPVGAGAFLLALFVSRRTARYVTGPLAQLATAAERVGRGDFTTRVEVAGPHEVLALAQQLENMREQLRQLETLKQGFLASVSHELRTPLTKIRESLSLLEDGAVGQIDPRHQRVIRIARNACEHEIRLVTTLLDLSRLRAGSPLRPTGGVVMDTLLQQALRTEGPVAHASGVELKTIFDGACLMGKLDPLLVECALANLIRNAIAVSSRGQSVEVKSVGEEVWDPFTPAGVSWWARITVSDHGPGVPHEIRERVFDAFVTEPVPGSNKPLGFGLGLALAREVTRAHGGELELLSSSESGTTFQMRLPMEGPTPEQLERLGHEATSPQIVESFP